PGRAVRGAGDGAVDGLPGPGGKSVPGPADGQPGPRARLRTNGQDVSGTGDGRRTARRNPPPGDPPSQTRSDPGKCTRRREPPSAAGSPLTSVQRACFISTYPLQRIGTNPE